MKASIVLLVTSACVMTASFAQQRDSGKSGAACGSRRGQLFTCPRFGFTYKVPFGWVDRTADIERPDEPEPNAQGKPGEAAPQSIAQPANAANSQTLLAVFERPPNAPGETINSAVLIAVESRSDYPQVKTPPDYFGPISDLAGQQGLKPVSDPYAFPVGTKQLVREDFSGARGKLTMFQSSLVMIDRGQIVSFTFIGSSEDDVDDLIDHLKFGAGGQQMQKTHR